MGKRGKKEFSPQRTQRGRSGKGGEMISTKGKDWPTP